MLAADSPIRRVRDVRAVPRRGPRRRWSTATSASRGLISVAQDDAAQGLAVACRAPGTRTARSWARSARSTCGSRCRAAATSRPASTSCPRRLDHLVATQTDEAMLRHPGLAGQGRGGGRRRADHPADLRARRRALLRRAVPAPDGVGPVDAEPPLRDRELVLRQLGVPGATTHRSRPGDVDAPPVFDPYSHDPARWGASLAHHGGAAAAVPRRGRRRARWSRSARSCRRPHARARRLGGRARARACARSIPARSPSSSRSRGACGARADPRDEPRRAARDPAAGRRVVHRRRPQLLHGRARSCG